MTNHRVRVDFDHDIRDLEFALLVATRQAAQKARMNGAPGQARVMRYYDASYLVDYVEVQWVMPIGSEQPPDVYAGEGVVKEKISRRLGEIPR